MDPNHAPHEQKIEYARAALWAPFFAVGMVARVRGNVPPELLKTALCKHQILYPTLASRARVDADGTAWLTTEGVGQYSLEVRAKTSDEDWISLFLEQERIPFDFRGGPVTRFFLLRGELSSDLIAVAPHIVCDGYSMSHAICDVVALLNDPNRQVSRPMPAPAVTWQTVPHSAADNLFLRGFVRVLNAAWPESRVVLQHDQYLEMHARYWARQQNGLLAYTLPPDVTSGLVARCKQHNVSVTGALVAAFLLAQADVLPDWKAAHCQVGLAVNIRDRLVPHPGRAVGVYASSIDLHLRCKANACFWDLARQGCEQINKGLNDRPYIFRTLVLEELNPSIADALVVAVATDHWSPEFGLITPFLKIRGEPRCLEISNIGRIDLPEVGEPYRLETLLPFPPLVPGSRLALNVLTVNDQMHLILKFRQDQLDYGTVARIKDRALSYLAGTA